MKLKKAEKLAITDKFEKQKIAEVIKAFLVHGKSHRVIQREILNLPAPAKGGGFVVMEILHHYNIRGDKKGILKRKSLNELRATDDVPFKKSLDIYDELNLLNEEAEKYFTRKQEINENNNPTESTSKIKVRIYQNKLREVILSNYNSTCAICEINKDDLLVCSHIRPWFIDKNERLNPRNVICFCVLHDKMFDKGYFSLDSDFKIIFGIKADNQIRELLKTNRFKMPKANEPNHVFLKYHFEEMCN